MAQNTLSFWLRWDWRFWANASPSRSLTKPSRELRLPAPVAEDRRNWVRHDCGLGVSCQLIALAQIDPWPAVIQDISATGIALILDHPLPAGSLVVLHLPLPGGANAVRARVVSARLQRDAGWVLGCSLVRKLRPDELKALI